MFFAVVRDALKNRLYACSYSQSNVERCSIYEDNEMAVIPSTNACTHPGTVMVEAFDAAVTDATVRATRWAVVVTSIAVLHLYLVCEVVDNIVLPVRASTKRFARSALHAGHEGVTRDMTRV